MNRKALVAECIGTSALVSVGVGAIAADHMVNGSSGLVGIALAFGLTIAVTVSATAATSGGHLNPAVTFGAFLARKIDAVNAIGHVLAQCIGAILAAFFIKLATPVEPLGDVGMGTPALGRGVTILHGPLTEIVLTFFLVFTVFCTARVCRNARHSRERRGDELLWLYHIVLSKENEESQ